MDRHFARGGPEGRTMMCSTASVQVCLDAGADDAEVADRWHALHAWLPVLTALFANSPTPGWRCTRAAVWGAIDPTRTAAPVGPDPRSAYGRWALDAQLLAVRREAGVLVGAGRADLPGLAARRRCRAARADLGDLDYHLTTLFPPVRARGHLELRAVDAQPGDGWRVVVALVAALLDDPAARAAATAAATEASRGPRCRRRRVAQSRDAGGRAGRDDRPGAEGGRDDFVATAVGALTRAGQPELAAAVAAFGERYPARRRCPADDRATDGTARPCVGPTGRGTDRATDRRPHPRRAHDRPSTAHRRRPGPGPPQVRVADRRPARRRGADRAALADHVPAGVGLRPRRQPGGALAGPRRGRPRAGPGRHRRAVRRVQAPAQGSAGAPAARPAPVRGLHQGGPGEGARRARARCRWRAAGSPRAASCSA